MTSTPYGESPVYVDYSGFVDTRLLSSMSYQVRQSFPQLDREAFKLKGVPQGPTKIRFSRRNQRGAPESEHRLRGSSLHWSPCRVVMQRIPSLWEIIEQSGLFREVGRILMIWSDACETPEHTDHEIPDLQQHFLWLNPEGSRRLYLKSRSGSVVIPPTRVLWFDSRLPHGTVGSNFPAYSIRVDGKFTSAGAEAIRASRIETEL